jgi:hypothetical protein
MGSGPRVVPWAPYGDPFDALLTTTNFIEQDGHHGDWTSAAAGAPGAKGPMLLSRR